MKWLKRLGLTILFLPIALTVACIAYEIIGMCVNHMATRIQTNTLQTRLEREISDIEIIDIYSETGNTSGTGNHVDCMTSILFSTQMQENEIKDSLSQYYTFDEWSCHVTKTEDGCYRFYINTSAPFADNIEGH